VWALLAADHLAVMASSVSSERAFSSAGITISKHRSRLKGDIVEALQCLKCMLRHELIFREPEPCTATETALEDEAVESHPTHEGDLTWDDSVLADNEESDDE
jgi:hypothetical protein